MAACSSFKHFFKQDLGKFLNFLICAALDWILKSMLFINGFSSFLANGFAKYFKLKLPCLLCSRMEYVVFRRNNNFYYTDSTCEAHKREVSYLAYCHVHKKLSYIRKMCEGCLLSFATEKESCTDTYKSLVEILRKDAKCFVDDDHQIISKFHPGKKDDDYDKKIEEMNVLICSCCGVPLKVKEAINDFPNKRSLLSSTPTSSPRTNFRSFKNRDSRSLDFDHMSNTQFKYVPENERSFNSIIRDNQESEDLNEDPFKTPNYSRTNRFFGTPHKDSPSASPRWTSTILKKTHLEKIDFSSESLEPNTTSTELEGSETIVHRLKRQVRLDRKSLTALYMELDEERSASAVAANNAMAMITRLQAEKAGVQMEALQYQRMMEEQAVYDQEALQAMKDFLDKKEENFKKLETELEVYRKKYGTIRENNGIDEYEIILQGDEYYQPFDSQSQSPCSEISENNFKLNFQGESSELLAGH